MATVTVFTAERMQAIEDATLVSAIVSEGHLIFTRHDGTTFDAGQVLVEETDTAGLPPNIQTGATYTLAIEDRKTPASSGMLIMDSDDSNVVTFPEEETVNFPINSTGEILQLGAGRTTLDYEDGVTLLYTSASLDLREQNALVGWRKIAANTFLIGGQLD